MTDLHKTKNGRWVLRWREGDRRRSRTFDYRKDAEAFETERRRRKQLGHAAIPEDMPLREFAKIYWRLYAIPNLADSTRDFYARSLSNHIIPRLGDVGVREISPKRLVRFREDLERAHVGVAAIRKAMAILQSVLSFAVAEELAEFNAATGVRKPRYERARTPYIFSPAEVEQVRSRAPTLRDSTLIAVLAYSGPRPEEVVCRLAWGDIGERTIRYKDTKRHRERFTPLLAPLADDLRAWFMASGRPSPSQPVFPNRHGDFWDSTYYANWRRTVWKGVPVYRYERVTRKGTVGCAPAGTRPRDLRSSFITLRVYEGIPLHQLAREVGTSIPMIERHYASILENFDGRQVPAEQQIREARAAMRRTG